MEARVVQFRDYTPKPKERPPVPESGAVVVILPMIRVGLYDVLPSDCEPHQDPA